MKKNNFMFAAMISLIALLFTVQTVLAHQTVTVGNYDIEYGWVNEPPIVGQRNAFVVNIADKTSPGADIDVSNLMVMVSYGGQERGLVLQPLGEDTPGQFIGPILPTIAGTYTLELMGKLGNTDVNLSVEPEEVQPAEKLEFPPKPSAEQQSAGLGLVGWLAIAGLAIGLISLVLSLVNMKKAPK